MNLPINMTFSDGELNLQTDEANAQKKGEKMKKSKHEKVMRACNKICYDVKNKKI